jgi:hypothetical protein
MSRSFHELAERAGAGSLTLAVDDSDAQIAKLDELHIDIGNRSNSARVKTVMITDPDGNHIAFEQAIYPGMKPVRRARLNASRA